MQGWLWGCIGTTVHNTTTSGNTITNIYPIGFTSKCTSPSEEHYKPYLLKFAALKFTFDQFGSTVWGFPVESGDRLYSIARHTAQQQTVNSARMVA